MRILPEALDQRMLDRYPSLPMDGKPFTSWFSGSLLVRLDGARLMEW